MKSPYYKRLTHPLIIRLLSLWRVLITRNFILIQVEEINIDGESGRKIRITYRTDYDSNSDSKTLDAAYMKSLDEKKNKKNNSQ